MSLKEFKLPDIGEGVAEGEIVSWKVAVGDVVKEEQDFVEVMTDKATVTITVPYDGVIQEIRFKEGDVVPVETVIAVIDTAGGGSAPAAAAPAAKPAAQPAPKAAPAPAPSPSPAPVASPQPVATHAAPSPSPVAVASASPGKVLAAPATRKRAREAGVDLATVPASGPHGRVTTEDLESFLNGGQVAARPATAPATSGSAAAPAAPSFAPIAIAKASSPELEERVPFRGVRKKIAEAMTRSKFTATHFTVVEDMDVTELVAMRNAVKKDYADEGVKITYLPFIMKAVVAGLRQFPWLNASLDESTQEVVLKNYYNLGIATDTDNGLIVPVIHSIERKSIVQIARELQDLASRTRDGKVMPDELRGGTFSITNAGNIGGLFATPIINFPEVAILGVHKIHDAPRVVDGEIRIRKVMYLSVSIDHRIVDGADGVRFLNVVKRCLEDPKKLVLEA
ncbi:MAG: 2-oxo acid dehydrogenase subunit E2 [Planctomycetes bacterium]|nr:2-oxo acid dehydrogenase subunit E2 [Planctomycetota bacterium]MCB9919518.1 2-oxo acid dehydrogenase subunit E2 [Planctomycetota bacterium]